MTRWAALLLLAVTLPQDPIYSNSYKGKAPPEIASEKSQWLNAADKVTLAGLKGKVVWLEYGFIN